MKLEKLTKKQEQHLETVKNEWLSLLSSGKEIDTVEATKGIKWLYKFSNLKEPIIIFLDSPFACQIGAEYAVKLLKKLKLMKNGNQVRDQVGIQVRDKVWSQVGNKVWSQVGNKVCDQVRSQVLIQVKDKVWSQVWSQVRNQVGNKVCDQVRSQVESQVWDQVESQVWSQVRNQVGNQVRDQVWDQVESQVWDQVESQVWSQVWDQVGNQVRDQVWDQVGSQVESQVREKAIKFRDFSTYGNIWDYGWLSFYTAFEDLGIDLGESKKEFIQFRNLVKSGVFNMIQLNGLCIVSSLPKHVKRNTRNDLHCENGSAIEWRDGYKQHYLNGVFFPQEMYDKVINKDFQFSERMKIVDVDQRTQAINPKFCDIDAFIKEVKGELLDEVNKLDVQSNTINYKLYRFPKGTIFQEDAYYCYFDCPSTKKKHLEGVEVSKTVAEAMAWAEDISIEDWKLRVPLLHEN